MSTHGAGSGVELGRAVRRCERSNCMKTRFQISIQPVPSGVGLLAEAWRGRLAVAVEEVDLGARAARAGVAHLPEVVGHARGR